MNYLILSITVIGLAYFYERLQVTRTLSKGVKRLFYGLICFALCLFAGLRTSYNDTYAYIADFANTPQDLSSLFDAEFSLSGVYLFRIWGFLIYHLISKNVHVYLFLSAAVLVCPAVRLIEKHSSNFTFSMMLFMFGGMYLFSLAGLKQAMATGVILIGLPHLWKKEYTKYYLYCILALGFHAYSLFFLIVPLLGQEIFNRRTVIFCVSIVLLGVLLSYLSGIISTLIEFLGKDVSEETIQSGSVNILRAVVFVVPLVLTIMARKKLTDISDEEKVFIKLAILSAVFMILALFGNPILFGRIPQYFLIGTVVVIPMLISKVFEEKERTMILTIAALCYILYGLYGLYIDDAFTRDIFGLIFF